MYINEIDDILNVILNDFYNTYLHHKKNKEFIFFKNLIYENNFVKYQKKINEIVGGYSIKIDNYNFNKITNNNSNILTIKNLLKKYIFYYIFLLISFFYKGQKDIFINNIIEFSRNQGNYSIHINNFFNSFSNSIIIKSFNFIKNIKTILNMTDIQRKNIKDDIKYKKSIQFLNNLGTNFINKNLDIKQLKGDEIAQANNIIKTIMILEIYNIHEKKEINDILNQEQKKIGTYKFIDVVYQEHYQLDYSSIESLLNKDDLKNGLADDYYQLLTQKEETDFIKTIDFKVQALINSGIFIPIVDDFLLFHNRNEKYEKQGKDKFQKYKSDTKIKYIVTKIDSASDLYTNIENNKKKKKTIDIFYIPLRQKKAINVNYLEDIRIIDKLRKMGKRVMRNNEYYLDLIKYKEYPYINFKTLKNNSFNFETQKTINLIRYISFENTTFFKHNPRSKLQIRSSSTKQSVNIVGLLFPSNNINCINANNVENIHNMINKKNIKNNGYLNILKLLKKTIFSNNNNKHNALWLFDIDKDNIKLDKYSQLKKHNSTENIKLILAQLYDKILEQTYLYIINEIKEQKITNIKDAIILSNKIQQNIIYIDNKQYLNNINEFIFQNKFNKFDFKYDINEDKFMGVFGTINKLIKVEKNNINMKNDHFTYIFNHNNSNNTIDKENDNKNNNIYICQHNITWDRIYNMRKRFPNKFGNLLYDFISQYAIETKNGNFICKSCNTMLNIKNSILDGKYDKETDKFIMFNSPILIPLEEVPYYEKYRLSIKNIDKLIERIASISNLNYYIGNTLSYKIRRRPVIKRIIDIFIAQYSYLKEVYTERRKTISSKYNISQNLSNLFNFKLADNIYTHSSKDYDYYKFIKLNNIISSIIIIFIIEINNSQILSMGGKKLCNYHWFNKYGFNLFNDIKIIINKNNDLNNITDYPLLCYLIYYFSCIISNYKIWYIKEDDKMSKRKKFIYVQQLIINTVIDMFNSILEKKKTKKYNNLYESFSIKFFDKLNNNFKKNDVLDKIKNNIKHKITVVNNKIIYGNKTKLENIDLQGFFKYNIRNNEFKHIFYNNFLIKYYLPIKKNLTVIKEDNYDFYNVINNLNIDLKKFISKDINNINKLSDNQIKEKYIKAILYKNKKKRDYIKYTLQKKKIRYLKKKNEKNEIIKNVIFKFKKNKNYNTFILNFINHLEKIIGKNINIYSNNLYLNKDSYIINYNHNGVKLKKPYITTSTDYKVTIKYNHDFFKKDVYHYIDYSSHNKVDVFYDINTHLLLGYKERNQKYTLVKNSSIKIIINYSIKSRLLLFGFNNTSVKLNKTDNIKHIVNNIFRTRINNLKFIFKNIKTTIYRFKNQYVKPTINVQEKNFDNDYDDKFKKNIEKDNLIIKNTDIFDKYNKKLKKITLSEKNIHIFENSKQFISNIEFKNINDIKINNKDNYINCMKLIEQDNIGNMILFYIISELNNLIYINHDKFTKNNLVFLIIDIINEYYIKFNNDLLLSNNETKRFNYILNAEKYLIDINQEITENKELGFYDEYKDPNEPINEDDIEKEIDNYEEQNAIDMENSDEDI